MTTTHLISLFCIFSLICTISTVPLWCGRPYYPFNNTNNNENFAHLAKPNNYFVVNPSVEPFTSEKQGQLLVNIDPNYGDSVIFQAKYVSIFIVSPISLTTGERHDLSIDVTKLPLGQYSNLQCRISTNSGELIVEKNITVGRWPDKANAVKIDHKSNGFIINGLPMLPMGYYFDWGRPQLWDVINTEATLGFNAPLPYRPPLQTLDGVRKLFDQAHKLGTKMILDMVYITESQDSKQKFGNITAVVNGMKDHPALLAYYIADEPDGSGFDADYIVSSYNLIKQLDPYHPVILVLNCLYNINNYTKSLDVIMTDPYPIGIVDSDACDYCQGEPMDIYNRFTAYKTQTQNEYPMWLVPQAFGGAEEWTRQPTAAEERAMIYLALVNGVRGVIFFTEGIPFTGLWASCRQLTEEVAELAPWFLSYDKANEISIESRDLIDGSVNKNVKGNAYVYKNYLMVVLINGRNSMSQVKVTIKDLDASIISGVAVFQQNRVVSITNGVFTDMLDGYASRAIRIELKKHTPYNNPKNLIRNPSFESTPSVSQPDGYSFYVSDGSSFATDTRMAVDGLKSFRIHCFNESCSSVGSNGVYTYYNVQPFGVSLKGGQQYSYSVYMRADRSNVQAALYMLCGGKMIVNQVFTTTMDWQQYTVQSVQVNSDTGCWPRMIVLTPGTVWFDVVEVQPAN